jgi:hypothetical protein
MNYPYSKRKIRCWALIDGKEYEVSRVTTEFALNSIPSATISLVPGVNVSDGKPSTAHDLEDSITALRHPIEIWSTYEIESEFGAGYEFTPDVARLLMFEGYVTGFGYQRSASGVAFSLAIEHWLSDLTASSMISSSTHSMTAGDLQRSVILQRIKPGTRAFGNTFNLSYVKTTIGGGANVAADLWENGIKKIAVEGASNDQLAELDTDSGTSCGPNSRNAAALGALARMSGTLSLRLIGSDSQSIGNAIVQDLSKIFLEDLAGQTAWDNIIASSANYMFAVVPKVSDAIVVPFCPSLSVNTDAGPFKEIPSEQIENISISGDMPRTIRGVALLFTQESAINVAPGTKDTGITLNKPGGVYIAETEGCKGTILYKYCPGWIANTGPIDLSNNACNRPPFKAAAQPDAGVASDQPTATQQAVNKAPFRDAVAKAIYCIEVLKGRQGTITGPYRTDIGVGSLIRFELPATTNVADSVSIVFVGMVLKVVCSIDAQASQSSTTFTLGYVRTDHEDSLNIMTVTEHPIYNDPPFRGTSLDSGAIA